MHQLISEKLLTVRSLKDIEEALIPLMAEYREKHDRLGYVSGVITTDGPEHVSANIQRLNDHTERLRAVHDFPIFAPTDVFTDFVYANVSAESLSSTEFKQFWRNVLATGHVTDIFMTPRWEVSGGARDEHEAALELNLLIHYLNA